MVGMKDVATFGQIKTGVYTHVYLFAIAIASTVALSIFVALIVYGVKHKTTA